MLFRQSEAFAKKQPSHPRRRMPSLKRSFSLTFQLLKHQLFDSNGFSARETCGEAKPSFALGTRLYGCDGRGIL